MEYLNNRMLCHHPKSAYNQEMLTEYCFKSTLPNQMCSTVPVLQKLTSRDTHLMYIRTGKKTRDTDFKILALVSSRRGGIMDLYFLLISCTLQLFSNILLL